MAEFFQNVVLVHQSHNEEELISDDYLKLELVNTVVFNLRG
jgi:hypothetical protein